MSKAESDWKRFAEIWSRAGCVKSRAAGEIIPSGDEHSLCERFAELHPHSKKLLLARLRDPDPYLAAYAFKCLIRIRGFKPRELPPDVLQRAEFIKTSSNGVVVATTLGAFIRKYWDLNEPESQPALPPRRPGARPRSETNKRPRRSRWLQKSLLVALGALPIIFWAESPPRGGADETLFRQKLSPPAVPCAIDATIAGEKTSMVVETGAEDSIIDPSFRGVLTPSTDRTGCNTLDGQIKSRDFYEVSTLVVQSLRLEHAVVTLSPFQRLSDLLGHDVSGYLGARTFQQGKLLMGYSAGEIEFHRGPWRLDTPDTHEQDLLASVTPQIQADIGGHRCTFIISAGSVDCISLESSVFDALAAEGFIESAYKSPQNKLTPESPRGGWFVKGAFMGKDLAGVSVDASRSMGHLGDGWLCGFDSEIDFAGRRFRFRQLPHAKAPVEPWAMFGAMVSYDEFGGKVERLRPDGKGAAESAGLRTGDLLSSIDGVEGVQLNAVTLAEIVEAKAGRKVDVEYLRPPDSEKWKIALQLPDLISIWHFAGRDAAIKSATAASGDRTK